MKTYCYSCGARSEFSAKDKPRFCAKCGTSFLDGSKRKERADPTPVEATTEEEDVVNIPIIDGLDFEFDSSSLSTKGEKLGAIMGTTKDQPTSGAPATNMPKMTKKETMELFQKEAGAIREKPKKKDAQT